MVLPIPPVTAYSRPPWQLVRDGQGNVAVASSHAPDPVTRARYEFIAHVAQPSPLADPMWENLTWEQSVANGTLLALAPQLLDACRLALTALNERIDPDGHSRNVGTLTSELTARQALQRALAAVERGVEPE